MAGDRDQIFKLQLDAVLNQATPGQNTWHILLDTVYKCRIIYLTTQIDTTGETIEVELTIDGRTITSAGLAQTNDLVYDWYIRASSTAIVLEGANAPITGRAFLVEGRSVKIRVRKTTANAGPPALRAVAVYQTL